MPISAKELNERTAFVTLYDGDLTVHYRIVEEHTLDEDAALAELAKKGKSSASVAIVIDRCLSYITSWDLLDKPEKDGGKPIPLTKEGLKGVPADILTDILAAIRADRSGPGE